jgi:hypothetical protein
MKKCNSFRVKRSAERKRKELKKRRKDRNNGIKRKAEINFI